MHKSQLKASLAVGSLRHLKTLEHLNAARLSHSDAHASQQKRSDPSSACSRSRALLLAASHWHDTWRRARPSHGHSHS